MAYQALYRVWRPQTFEDVTGQSAITQTLKNAVATDQVSHAYLFTGSRGTGKTSCAKILAKAVNCPQQQAGEPCNQCAICQAINAGSLNDVLEIDAASNNGVEQIRDIRDKVKYAPTQAEYKVYIIDEVHMLSTGAFNALLKTLEEPPAKVIFILATTEPQKIPATIISRTQRFDFRRIPTSDLIARMEFILKEKELDYDVKGVQLIAQAAQGGMRDALSMLDQALALDLQKLTLANALQVTGALDEQQLVAYFQAVFIKDAAKSLQNLHDIMNSGRSALRFCDSVIEVARDLLLTKSDPNLIDAAQSLVLPETLMQLQEQVTKQQLYTIITQVSQTQQDLKNADRPLIYLEVLTVQLVEAMQPAPAVEGTDTSADLQVKELQQKITSLQEQVTALQNDEVKETKPMASTTSKKVKPAPKNKAVHVDQVKINQILQQATRKALNQVQDCWPDLMSMLNVTQKAVMKVSKPVAASADGVIVAFDYAVWFERVMSNQEMMTMLKTNLDRLLQNDADVILVAAEDWPKIRQKFLQNHEMPIAAPDDPQEKQATSNLVEQAQNLFGTDLVEVKHD
ncbi:DNA polymerase III subunit gamma/tau [Bombilactobacillus thymidiniphilus]|uniref:DNA-directed DNA polymerase n=1 Tax=Bombilactobacillus thymidiniphilus TaxID=2923363 RepID=A0ABY4PE81_9LACO|nr:DNA polymerase III subunit gamma/tau [Bombilactobacillus thymidiniphilus]UQS83935.1 DNA polymerase III subunit gamma/tau [Bombilactobacillus thymidiniphilus]